MNDWVIPMVIRKPLVDDGRNIHESSLGVPIQKPWPQLLDAHFGGHTTTSRDPPQHYERRVEQLQNRFQLNPDDSLAFGGYSGVNFLQRDTKQT